MLLLVFLVLVTPHGGPVTGPSALKRASQWSLGLFPAEHAVAASSRHPTSQGRAYRGHGPLGAAESAAPRGQLTCHATARGCSTLSGAIPSIKLAILRAHADQGPVAAWKPVTRCVL